MDNTRAIRQIAAAKNRDRIISVARAFYRSHGFHALSIATQSSEYPGKIDVETYGLPEAFVAHYDSELNRLDPFPALVAMAGRPIRYSRVSEEQVLSSDHETFLEEARSYGISDGYAFPTFGPHHYLAAVGITMADHPDKVEHADIPVLHSVAQALHLRLDQLERGVVERPRLAPREVTILHWIARGKSNEEIAMILGNKRPTIATHVKRIFIKLGVSDRASAAVRGLKYGLISL